MKTLEVTISITVQVYDTGDKTYDCLVAVDAAKKILEHRPSYDLLRNNRANYGDPQVQIVKLRSMSMGGIVDVGGLQAPPLNIEVPVE
jgi:hypothetical protein